MLKKFLFGIAFIAIAAIAAINLGISSEKNFLVDLKNANTEALAGSEGGGLGVGTVCDDSQIFGPYYDACYDTVCWNCSIALYVPSHFYKFCAY